MKMLNALMFTTLASLTSIARADDDFHLRLGHNVLLQTWTQSKANGETYRESSTETFKGGWELYAYGQGLNLYSYPGQEGSSVIVGYSLWPVYVSLGDKETLELTLSLSFTQGRAKETAAAGSSTTSTDHGTAWTATALLDRKLGTACHYYSSLALVQSKFKSQDTQSQIHNLSMKRSTMTGKVLARAFIPILALRKPSLYITVSSSSVASSSTALSMESLSHTVQFMMTQALCLESKDNPSLHNIVLYNTETSSDAWITASNVDAALATLIRNAEWNRGYSEFQNNWRDRMEEPGRNIYVGGI